MFANVLYSLALLAVSPLVGYRAIRFGRYRRGWAEKLWGLPADRAETLRSGSESLLWVHAVSVGEVNLLPGLVKRLQADRPGTRVVVSTSTDSGYDLAVRHFGRDRVFFCPLDFTWSVKRTLRQLDPAALVLTELELWPNLVRSADRLGCPVLVINARLSDRSAAGYRRFAWLTRPLFRRLAWVGCQDRRVAERFAALGTPEDRLAVTGSLKFDNAPLSRDGAEIESRFNWAGIDAWHRVWCFGSTQPGEDEMALAVYQHLRERFPDLRLILAPRHPERFEAVAALIERHGLRAVRRSRNESQYADVLDSDEVVLIDTIGELKHWWGVCHVATVGGSFSDRGGQNMLEPAGFGCAVSFGPDTRNFQQIARQLLRAGGAVRVANTEELEAFVARCLEEPPFADALGRAAQEVIRHHRGATDRTAGAILGRFPSRPARPDRQAA